MKYNFTIIQKAVLEFEEKERAELAKILLNSLDNRLDNTTEKGWDSEIEKRLLDLEMDSLSLVDGTTLHKQIRDRFKE